MLQGASPQAPLSGLPRMAREGQALLVAQRPAVVAGWLLAAMAALGLVGFLARLPAALQEGGSHLQFVLGMLWTPACNGPLGLALLAVRRRVRLERSGAALTRWELAAGPLVWPLLERRATPGSPLALEVVDIYDGPRHVQVRGPGGVAVLATLIFLRRHAEELRAELEGWLGS